jgi:hypothetical protein
MPWDRFFIYYIAIDAPSLPPRQGWSASWSLLVLRRCPMRSRDALPRISPLCANLWGAASAQSLEYPPPGWDFHTPMPRRTGVLYFKSGCGGIGRRTGLKIRRNIPYGFESRHPHLIRHLSLPARRRRKEKNTHFRLKLPMISEEP